MDEKMKALANDIMEQCQKQGLTCREVEAVMGNVIMQVSEVKKRAVEDLKFTALPF